MLGFVATVSVCKMQSTGRLQELMNATCCSNVLNRLRDSPSSRRPLSRLLSTRRKGREGGACAANHKQRLLSRETKRNNCYARLELRGEMFVLINKQ